ncbi:MAG: capsule assembly Wzi family protein, partial [Cyclonatronaceae bacterium]
HAGLVHFAVYGGSTPDFGNNPSGFSDYLRIIRGLGDTSPVIDAEAFALGDHLGIWDFGLHVEKNGAKLMLYRHFIYETPQELKFSTIQDGLLGFGLRFADRNWAVNGILFEHLYTRYQRGPIPPATLPGRSGQKDYYNHYVYIDGWTHFGRPLGTPLLITSPDGQRIANRRFASTRVESFHAGIEGQPLPSLSYRLLLTHSTHFGTYRGRRIAYELGQDYFFDTEPTQFSGMLEVEYQLPQRPQFHLMAAAAIDHGELYENSFGLLMGLRYSLLN